MACPADQLSEQQDVFRVEITVGQVVDDLRGFGRVVKEFGRLIGLLLRRRFGGFRIGNGLRFGLCGYGSFVNYGLRRLFLREVLIRFHVVDCLNLT